MFEIVLMWDTSVQAILKGGGGGAKSVHPFKGCVYGNFNPILRGGARNKLRTHDFPILLPPSRN